MAAVVALVVASGCVRPASDASADAIRVVATTSVLADLVAQVGGELVVVSSLVPVGGEVHTFDPTPADIRRVTEAELVIANGLGLDEWLQAIVEEVGADAPVVELGEGLPGAAYLEGGEHADEADHDPHAGAGETHDEPVNPHLWLNVDYAQGYVDRIVEALSTADPSNAARYTANAETYRARLAELHEYALQAIGAIPDERRRVIASHEAFPYFADAYGLTVVGVVVETPGQDPSVGEVGALIDTVRESGVSAILAESQFPSTVAERIAEETGVVVVRDLYSDSVGPPPVDTYEAMMRWNVQRIVEALR